MRYALKFIFLLTIALPSVVAMPVAAQTLIDSPEGPWSHVDTGLQFPAMIGEFERGQIVEYDDAGRDASVGYHYIDDNGRLTVTLYTYPNWPELTCAQIFDDTSNVVLKYRGIRKLSEGKKASPDGSVENAAHLRRYAIPEGSAGPDIPELISDLYLFCPASGKWLVKYRASWTGSEDTFPDMEQFLNKFEWPDALSGEARP